MTLRAVPTTKLVTPSQPTHSAGTCGTAEYASEKTQKLVCARRPSLRTPEAEIVVTLAGGLLPSHALGQRLSAWPLHCCAEGSCVRRRRGESPRPDFFAGVHAVRVLGVGAHRSSISPVCEQNLHFQE